MVAASATPILVAGASLEALAAAAWRLWIAGLLFVIVTIARQRFSWRSLRLTVWAGLAFGIATALFFSAIQLTSVANASVISVMQPLPLLVAAKVLFSEPIRRGDLAYVGISLAGAVFMVLSTNSSGSSDLGGDILAILAMFAAAGYFIFGKRARQSLDTDVFMAGTLFWTAIVIAPVALLSGQAIMPPDSKEWLRMIGLGLILVLAHGLINFANGRLPLAVIGLFQLIVPCLAGLLAWYFLDQSIDAKQALGIAVVLISLAGHTRYTTKLQPQPSQT